MLDERLCDQPFPELLRKSTQKILATQLPHLVSWGKKCAGQIERGPDQIEPHFHRASPHTTSRVSSSHTQPFGQCCLTRHPPLDRRSWYNKSTRHIDAGAFCSSDGCLSANLNRICPGDNQSPPIARHLPRRRPVHQEPAAAHQLCDKHCNRDCAALLSSRAVHFGCASM